jgi:hypothetical protein
VEVKNPLVLLGNLFHHFDGSDYFSVKRLKAAYDDSWVGF